MATEDYEKLSALAKELIEAPHSRIQEEGLEEFAQMCEAVRDRFFHAPIKVGRGALMVQLGTLAADIRQYPERFNSTPEKKGAAPAKREKSRAASAPTPQSYWLLFHPESDSYITVTTQAEFNEALSGEPLLVDVTGEDEHEKAYRQQRNIELSKVDGPPLTSAIPIPTDPDDEPW